MLTVAIAGAPAGAWAQETDDEWVWGIRITAGGRYDDVRMCVASDPGVRGGAALDVALFAEAPISDDLSLSVDLPVFRPIMFWLAFDMLQFDQMITLNFRHDMEGDTDLIFGPTVGLSLHYGPDFNSGSEGDTRGPSFFALGPIFGGFVGLDFTRPGESFNFQLGLRPYFSPLFSINDADDHRGIVVGGLLDGQFRFN